MANSYRVYNGVGNDVYKYDFMFVVNCNSYNNRLAIRAIPAYISSHIVNLDPEGKLIDRVYIPGSNSTNISLRDGTIKCTDWKTNN
jgi:hypothetical protein